MSKTEVKCKYCGNVIIKHGNIPIVNFTNIALADSPYYFCNRECKMIWLAEKQKKSEGKLYCQYCGSEWSSNRSKSQHERHCPNNPEVILKESERESYTIEDLRTIDRILGLTDEQIANFVRGKKK